MAKKDTINALVKKGIDEGTAAKLADLFKKQSDIIQAKAEGLVEKGFTEDEANDIMAKMTPAGKSRSSTKATKSTAVDHIEIPDEIEEVRDKSRVKSDMEIKVKSVVDDLGVELSPQVVTDIALRIEKANVDISDDDLRKIVNKAYEMCQKHMMDVNESVGVVSAQSIGEPGTQMNMRTFHHAGDANISVTWGLPRLIEIVDARSKPSTPSMKIPLSGYTDEAMARHVLYDIQSTCLENIANIDPSISDMCIYITPIPHKLKERNLSNDDVVEKLMTPPKSPRYRTLRESVIETDGTRIFVRPKEQTFKNLYQLSEVLKTVTVKGIDSITRAVLNKNKENDRWEITTEGSDLDRVIRVEGVDRNNVGTNSIIEIEETLGIEAAREAIIREAYETLVTQGGHDVDIRHIMLVADLMTNDGEVRAIGRNGVSRRKTSVLARAAFELTSQHLFNAAMAGEEDKLEGVAENIIVGQPVTLGTGAVKLVYKPKKGDEE